MTTTSDNDERVRRVREATADEVVASWVRAELQSERFGAHYRDALEQSPDLTPEALLRIVRGWPDREYFRGFPPDVRWWLVQVDADELRRVAYIDWGYWNEVSDGTRLPSTAAARMDWTEAMVPSADVEPLVLVTDREDGRMVVLEGHARLTRYVIAGDRITMPVTCYVGISPDMPGWWAF